MSQMRATWMCPECELELEITDLENWVPAARKHLAEMHP